ncbi:MAG: acyl-CoA dehydrogenase family protein [Nitrososphaerales archaeon]|jgi:alkylation response protein AidB-like acyl-CoA dehydrogenase
MAEEYQLLRSSVRDFAQKNIDNIAVRIEQEGLSPETAKSMASQGFMGARIPTEYGGTGLDERGYMIVLEELARCSPSAAVRVLITNSLFLPLVMASEKSREILRDVASAKTSVAVDHCCVMEGHSRTSGVVIEGSHASGRVDYVLNGSADAIIVAANDPQNSLLLVKAGFRPIEEHPRLGLRGLSFSSLTIDSTDFEKLSENGSRLIEAAVNDMDLEVAAISLGIAAGALAKAVEYSKVRTTFEHPLKEYQPVAFGLSLLRAKEEMIRDFAYKENHAAAGKTMTRVRAVALAKNATNQALQVHGGYGYFEDFGVEKFYRDAMALSILFSRGTKDMERLSEQVFDSKAGFL